MRAFPVNFFCRPWLGAAGWVATDWCPGVYATGAERSAWIVSPSLFSRMPAEVTRARNKSEVAGTFNDRGKRAGYKGVT